MPAKSMSSYSETLYSILDEFKPKTIFEWGPGISTQIMSLYPSVEMIVSTEHELVFFEMVEKLNLGNVLLKHEDDMDAYVSCIGNTHYDLIFIDGRDRARCLELAKTLSDLVMLHDAARSDYRESVDHFKYQVWTDEGNTAVLTNSDETYARIKSCLFKLICETPNPEKVRMVGHSEFKGEKF